MASSGDQNLDEAQEKEKRHAIRFVWERDKLDTAIGILSNSGWAKFPLIGGMMLIVKWGRWEGGVTSTTYNCNITFPVAFPAAYFSVYSSAGVRASNYDYEPSYRTLSKLFQLAIQRKSVLILSFSLTILCLVTPVCLHGLQ